MQNKVRIFGNFLFTKSSSYEDWYLGLVLEIEIKHGNITSQLHPVKQEKESFELSLLNGNEKLDVLNRISKYNDIISNSVKLKNEWDIYIKSKYDSYLNYWSPLSFISNRYFKAVFNKLRVKMINKRGMALTLNLVRCEAHADMSKEVARKYLSK